MSCAHKACKFCGLDIEGHAPYRNGEWRDRGNNAICPHGSNKGKAHAPYRETYRRPKILRQHPPCEMLAKAPATRAQATPGPWIVRDQGGHSVIIESAACSMCNINPEKGQEGYQIAEVFNAGPECGQEDCRAEAMANARLMAGARGMRDALERLLRDMEAPRSRKASDAWDAARAALKAAR